MKAIFYTLIFICFSGQLSAQTPVLHIFPDPAIRPQYPNTEITYYLFPWFPECHVLDTIIGGTVVNKNFYDSKLKVTIIWQEPANALLGKIVVTRPSTSCAYAAPDQSWDILIASSAGAIPVVTGAKQYYMGQDNFLTMTADFSSPTTSAVSFEWQAPPEWILSAYGAQAGLYVPGNNPLAEGCIRVRGQYPWGTWSDWVDYCLTGTIPSPCPIQLSNSMFLCGDTTEHWAFTVGVYSPQLPAYTWAVPPGWRITSINPNVQSAVSFQPDGHTNGPISVFATAGDFTSTVCEYPLGFLVAAPATTVLGPDYVCQTGEFRLSFQPPAQSEVTWQVVPVNPNTPQAAFPDHGSGAAAAFQVGDSTLSGYFRITYTITNACGSITRNKVFFIGKPRFFNPTLDGVPYTAQLLCPGYHGANTEVEGMRDAHVAWSASPQVNGYTQRDSFVFSFASAGAGNCPVVTARASNVCGTSVLPLENCERTGCSPPPLDVRIYPNPAYLIVSLETTTADATTEDYALIEQIEVFNHLGQLVTTWHEPPSHRIVKAIVDFPSGLYTLRITVWGQPIIKRLMITPLF